MVEIPDLEVKRAKYRAVAPLLCGAYGAPTWRQHLPPVDELVSTILSQNTNDANRDRAFDRLRKRCPTWEAVRDAPVETVIDAIRPAGLANQKGPRIQEALRYLTETQGSITLDHLADMALDDAKAWLTQINGVGPKTAAIILLFAFGRPAFPVDTHVHRVSKRLGLIDSKTSAERAHIEMEQIILPEDFYAFHLNMIQHGRTLCHARTDPECARCPLTAYCNYYSRNHRGSDDGQIASP
ncbi:MAG: endonuclease III [Anaerolineae bacterium]|nr:endonuclease III [Anaerolineae bacterium]